VRRLVAAGLLAAGLALASAAPPAPAHAQTVVTGISADKIALTANFTGSEIFVFGAIRRDAPSEPDGPPLDIIITIKGPERNLMVRRKERRLGIWFNAESVRVRDVPTFYAIASTRPLEGLLTETERLRHQIGMDQAVRRVGGHDTIEDTTPYTDALVRLKERAGSYQRLEDQVAIAEETLFQTRIQMPANLVEGDYAAQFFLVRDRQVISDADTLIRVEKTGIERWIYNLSRSRPLLYGLASVAAALAAGWLAAEAFRLARR
jgi:uncharacterized protein (TIGR02186 family)